MSVYKKLQEARVKLHSMNLTKTGDNKFAGFKYFELGDFLPQVQEIFLELGLCGVVTFKEEARLTILDTESGGYIEFNSPIADVSLKGCHPVQNMGAVQTYIRRYLWTMALEIVEHDVVDSTVKPQEKPKKETTKKEPPNQLLPVIEQIKAMASQTPCDYKAIKAIWDSHDDQKKGIIWKLLNSGEKAVVRYAAQGQSEDSI